MLKLDRSKRAFYRKLPVTIVAFQWYGHASDEPENDLVRYFRHPDVPGGTKCKHCGIEMSEHGWIDTLEAGHNVCPNDWIIKGIAGEFYPCKPTIFDATYKAVKSSTTEFTKPEKVLDGADMNQDIHQLIGYCISLGWTEKVMPSTHASELATAFLDKHRTAAEELARSLNHLILSHDCVTRCRDQEKGVDHKEWYSTTIAKKALKDFRAKHPKENLSS